MKSKNLTKLLNKPQTIKGFLSIQPACAISLVLSLLFTNSSFCQSDCDKILQYGIYNDIRKSSQSNNYKQEQQNSCSQLDEAISKAKGGGGGISFAGFGLSGSYNEQELRSIKQLYCEGRISTASADQIIQEHSRIISADVLDAYTKCREITKNQNIQLQLTASNDNFSILKISLTGRFSNPKLAPSFQQMDIDTSIFKIENPDLYDASQKGETLNRSYSMTLRRKILKEKDVEITADNYGRRKILSPEGLISINLNDQPSLVIKVPEISYWIEPVYVKSPLLGQIIASVLDSATFFKHFNTDEWMLANGQDVPPSAKDFKEMYGSQIPDLRGVFLRGKNYSRNDEYKNPDGDVNNGTKQKDIYESHDHNFSKPLTFPTQGGGYSCCNGWSLPVRPEEEYTLKKTDASGGNETRPKNVTVSYYIRIRVKDNNQ